MSSKPTFISSQGFVSWLDKQNSSLIFTARRIGKVFCLGVNADKNLTVFERTFPEPRGLAVHDETLYLADHFRIWRFENALQPNSDHPFEQHDRVYLPEMMWRTGNQDSHEIGLLKNGLPAFVATGMNAIATVSATHSLQPLWMPPFISDFVYEDRCHLNGMAIDGGTVKYATALAATDVPEGWRDNRITGGLLMDVEKGSILCDGLCMPHSPRLDGKRVWLANSGQGEVGFVEIDGDQKGIYQRHAFVPGFVRGMIVGDEDIIVSTSRLKESSSFQALPLETMLRQKGMKDEAGIFVIDKQSGDIKHHIILGGIIDEIYDVALLNRAKNMLLGGLKDDLSASLITIAPTVLSRRVHIS